MECLQHTMANTHQHLHSRLDPSMDPSTDSIGHCHCCWACYLHLCVNICNAYAALSGRHSARVQPHIEIPHTGCSTSSPQCQFEQDLDKACQAPLHDESQYTPEDGPWSAVSQRSSILWVCQFRCLPVKFPTPAAAAAAATATSAAAVCHSGSGLLLLGSALISFASCCLLLHCQMV
jgi:hypothetical protein